MAFPSTTPAQGMSSSLQRDLLDIMRSYVIRMLARGESGTKGQHERQGRSGKDQEMKVLIVDDETVRSVATVMSQRDVLQYGVYLTERIDKDIEKKIGGGGGQEEGRFPHMKAVYFVRPTKRNVTLIRQEMREPRFGEYELCTCLGWRAN